MYSKLQVEFDSVYVPAAHAAQDLEECFVAYSVIK